MACLDWILHIWIIGIKISLGEFGIWAKFSSYRTVTILISNCLNFFSASMERFNTMYNCKAIGNLFQ